jgi:hypothetical protein
MVFECAIGEDSDVYDDVDYEQHSYIRDPDPRLPDFVGSLGEEQLVSLAGRHIAANVFDQNQAARYASKANALRAELSACEAKAKQHAKSLQRG